MCLKEIGLHALKFDIHSRFDSEHNWRALYIDHLKMSTRFFTLIMNKIFIRAPKIVKNVTMVSNAFIFTNHLVLISCFISS